MTDRTDLHAIVTRANPVPDAAATAKHLDVYQPLLTVIDERSEAMTHSTRESWQDEKRTPPRRRSNAWAFGATFAAVLFIIGITVLVVGRGTTPVADESVTETTVTPTTVTEAPLVAVPLLRWVRVEDQEALADGGISSVAVGGPGLVAVGQAAEVVEGASPDDDASEDAAVWVSTDGMTWDRVVDSSFAGESESDCREFFVGSQEMTYVAAGPLGVVAAGRDACSSAVWFSEDGLTWTEAIADDWRSNPLAVEAVAAGGPGWVAVGGDGRGNGGVWVSSNGLDWTAVSDDDLLWADQRVDLYDVTAGGPGLVAVGISGTQESGAERSVVFVSADGLEWERVSEDAVGGAGLFRVGHDPATGRLMTFSRPDTDVPHHVAWVSTDGVHWTPSESAAPPANNSVAWNGERLVAAGPGWKSTYLSLWASPDGGNTWIDVSHDDAALDPGHEATDIATIDGRVIVVGANPEDINSAAVWIGEWTTK
jgi:hypothetical protein